MSTRKTSGKRTKGRASRSETAASPRRKTRPAKAAAGYRKAATREQARGGAAALAGAKAERRRALDELTRLEAEAAEEIGETLPPEPDVVEDEIPEVVEYEQVGPQDDDEPPDVLATARAVRTPAQVVAWAKRQHDIGASGWHMKCQKFARMAAGAGGGAATALIGWRQARYRHRTGTPPAGSFVWWGGGRYGHVAVSIGGGYIWSTDIRRRGYVDRVSISYLTSRWNMPYFGWSEDINNVRIRVRPPPPGGAPRVSLANLRPRKRNADVKLLQSVLRRKGYSRFNPSGATGYYGAETQAMVRAFQLAQGWRGADADGVPGPKTCARLGLALR